MVAQPLRDAGEPRQRSLAGVAVAGVVEPPVQDGGPVVGGVEFPAAGDCRELGDRVGAVRGEQQQMGAEGGPGRLVDEAGHNLLGGDVQRLDDFASGQVFGGHMEGVDIAGGGVSEPDGRVVLVALQGGGGPRRASSRARICSSSSVAVDGWTVSGRMRLCGSPSPTTCR